LMQYQIPQG